MINANNYLEQNYPKYGVCQIDDSRYWDIVNNQGKRRAEITSLNVTEKELTGVLDLTDFIQLEKLYCYRNKLIKIILPTNNRLVNIHASKNLLTSFDYASLNHDTLTDLRICNNKLKATDIAVFSKLINLEFLSIGGNNWNGWDNWNLESLSIGINSDNWGNQFYGSLSSLKNCTKLNHLSISNTNINSGLEYLPDSLKNFYCQSSADYKSKEIEKELKKHKKLFDSGIESIFLLKRWKEDFYQKNPNFKASLIKSITEERINESKKLLPLTPLIRNSEKNINPLNITPLHKDEITFLKTENTKLNSEIFQLKYKITEAEVENTGLKYKLTELEDYKYKLAEAEDYIEKLEKQLLERRISAWSISNNPQTTLIEAEFTESIEVSNHHPQLSIRNSYNHPQSFIYRNPQER